MKGETSRKLLELAIIRVGEINEAPYELAAHQQNRRGMSDGYTPGHGGRTTFDWPNPAWMTRNAIDNQFEFRNDDTQILDESGKRPEIVTPAKAGDQSGFQTSEMAGET